MSRNTIQVRVSPLIKKRIETWAKRCGLNPSAFARMAILEGSVQLAQRLGVVEPGDFSIGELPELDEDNDEFRRS